MNVWIINIGTELTIGRIVNTNGSWLARELTLRGAKVKRIIVVPDEEEEVVSTIREALKNAKIIITTGGLGPTPDDRTIEFIAKALGRKLVLHPDALRMVREKYEEKGLEISEERKKMAILPEGGIPIPNPVGTAPGLHIAVNDVQLFALPGVPKEMMAMFKSYVLKTIEPLIPPRCIVEEGITVTGYPESELAPLLKIVGRKYPLAYIKSHPKGGELKEPIVEIKVMVSSPSCEDARKKAQEILDEFKLLIAEYKPRYVA